MWSTRWRLVALLPGLGLGGMACHPASPAPVAPKRTFPDVASALQCARDAMASAGFLVEPRQSPTTPHGANSIGAQIVTGDERHMVGATAWVRVGPKGDTTVVLSASALTLAGPTGMVRPVSSIALRGRDAIEVACILP